MKQNDMKDLYVLDATIPTCIYGSGTIQFEESIVLRNCICKKEVKKNQETSYRNLETNARYIETTEFGNNRVNNDTINLLEDYYKLRYILKNIKELKEIHEVHHKVRKLKKSKKI